MPTKKEIYELEKSNDGKVIHLYPEGMFFRAYEQSAFLLCEHVHPFKVSCHYVKTVNDFLATVGFPQASLGKWTAGFCVTDVTRTLGLTRAGVGHWINNDDCKLSYREQYINAEDIQCLRLFFPHSAITKPGVTTVRLAKDMDPTYNTVRHWFVVDDIHVSHIFTIADPYDPQVCVNIRPKDNE